jgi:hypothetical protein
MEDKNQVEDVTVEDLSESGGAHTYGSAGSASCLSTPLGSFACLGTTGSF